MSDFRLPEIAQALGKDSRTLRRWCEAGHVAGAFRTAGGHWRVTGESLAEIVEKITPPDNARNRTPNGYPDFVPLAFELRMGGKTPMSKKVIMVRGKVYDRLTSQGRMDALVAAFELLNANLMDRLDRVEDLERENLAENLGDEFASWWISTRMPDRKRKQQRTTAAGLARLMHISRSTFFRFFPSWKKSLLKTRRLDSVRARQRFHEDGAIVEVDFLDFDGMAERLAALGWVEPDVEGIS